MFSNATEYAIKACIWLALHSSAEKYATVDDIVEGTKIPKAFTAKTLQTLAKNKIINSVKGRKGGFFLTEADAKKMNLFTIVQVLDGKRILEDCVLGLAICSDVKPCPAHPKYAPVKKMMTEFLINTTLFDLTKGIPENEFFLSL